MSGGLDIVMQRFDAEGNPAGENDIVNNTDPPGGQRGPKVAVHESGGYVVTWEDTRAAATGQIFAQRYNGNGDPVDGNFKVNDVDNTANPGPLRVSRPLRNGDAAPFHHRQQQRLCHLLVRLSEEVQIIIDGLWKNATFDVVPGDDCFRVREQ